jgi:tetratricopeptide (TPR) repeat protein
MVREIIESNEWGRPIYFAVTCSEDSKIGLHDYLRMEGMAFRLVPEKRKPGIEFINADVVSKQIVENPGYSKDYKPGFKFRGLNSPEIFFDENHQRMSQNYRNAILRLALYYVNTNQYTLAIKNLDNMETKIPRKIIDMPFGLLYEVANLYNIAGAADRYKEYAKEVEEIALKNFEENPGVTQSYYDPFRVLLDLYENLKEYDKALELWRRISVLYPNDSVVKTNIEKYTNLTQKGKVETDSVPKSTN